MKQSVRKNIKKEYKVKEKDKVKVNRKRVKVGTSKLEERFAKNFVEKLNLKYEYQFEAKSIGRFYDFYLPEKHLLIEVDGDYYHSNPEKVDKNNLSPMQKRNKRVDEAKNMWAALNGIPLIRIWENDINNNPEKVMEMLKKRLYIIDEKQKINENKKKRH